jgi:hypothetical protein
MSPAYRRLSSGSEDVPTISPGVFLLSVLICLAGVIGGVVAAYYLEMWPGARG